MQRSTGRILTSHTGSLARPADLIEMLRLRVNGDPAFDAAAFQARTREAVDEVVRLQAEAGVDIVDDGELSKPQFADYIADRIGGFEGENPNTGWVRSGLRPEPFPEYAEWRRAQTNLGGGLTLRRVGPKCVGPLAWKDRAYETDIANLKSAMAKTAAVEGFLPSPSPGIIISRIPNEYYRTEEEYLFAVAEVLRDEYRAIAGAGLVLQIDAPDVAMSWASQWWDTMDDFLKGIDLRVEALNHALADVPEESVRFHICWGNNENPHTMDVELKTIVDIVLKVKAACYSIEASNPRHGHEWTAWETTKLPDGKMLMPGVIDSLTNFVEHPELVAQRIAQFAGLVGRENVIAGTDCGFGTGATLNPRVHPEIVWAKFRSLSEGARLASKQLWG